MVAAHTVKRQCELTRNRHSISTHQSLPYNAVAYVLEPHITDKAFRKSWARLIHKIYEVDPLVCPACGGAMRVIAFIEDQDVIRKISTHLGLWKIKPRPKPVAHGPPDVTCQPFSDAPASWAEGYQADPIYPDEAYF